MIQNSGSKSFTTSNVAIGTSGKPIRVFTLSFISGGTAGVILLHNGTSTSGTSFVREDGVISSGKTIPYGQTGIFFPAGCFLEVDANVTAGVVSYAQEAS